MVTLLLPYPGMYDIFWIVNSTTFHIYLRFYRKRICSFGCCVLGFCVNALGASTGLIDGYHDVDEVMIPSFVFCNEILNLAKSCENFSLLEML